MMEWSRYVPFAGPFFQYLEFFLKNQLLVGVCFNLGYEKCEIREPVKPFPFRKGLSHLVTDSWNPNSKFCIFEKGQWIQSHIYVCVYVSVCIYLEGESV